jgi:hypothetical protein
MITFIIASKPYLIGEMYLIQSKYTGIDELFTNRPEKIINGNKTIGVTANAAVKSENTDAKKIPSEVPQTLNNTIDSAKMMNE